MTTQAITGSRRTGDEPWLFMIIWITALAVFAVLFVAVWTHQIRQHAQSGHISDQQGKRLAGLVLAQAIMLREDRQAIIALAKMQRTNGDSIQALIESQLSQNKSMTRLAKRSRLISVRR